MNVDVLIIGGGSAGLAAAIEAKKAGTDDLLIIERDRQLGGILNQCIHNGFGLHTFKEELTGPEYASRYIEQAEELNIPYLLNSMVISIETDEETDSKYNKKVTVMSAQKGQLIINAKAIVLAMGCRERSRGALNIPGYRPAGVYTAGTAQYYVNVLGRMPGKEVVILGSGDIGLIMARRMTLEGAHVKAVTEIMPYSGGLKRNIVQCLDDYDIPLKLSHTVIDIEGRERVTGVKIAKVDECLKPIPGTEEHIECDTLLLSCGLIPENELVNSLLDSDSKMGINPLTSGPFVDESFETGISGIFACGNALHVHDLVDFVSGEAANAGKNAALYANDRLQESEGLIEIKAENGVRYTVPSVVSPSRMEDIQNICFRSGEVFRDAYVAVYFNNELVLRQKKKIIVPGEMQRTVIKKDLVKQYPDLKTITLRIEQEG